MKFIRMCDCTAS